MIATLPSGLAIATIYYFKVNTTEYSIVTGDHEPSFIEVAQLMDAALTSAQFSAVIVGESPNQDLRVINEGDRGWESEIELDHGTSGLNLWTNLTGFIDFDPAVPGRGAFEIIINSSVEAGGETTLSGAATYYFIDTPPVGTILLTGAMPADEVNVVGPEGSGAATLSGAAFKTIVFYWIAGGPGGDYGDASTYQDIAYQDDVYMQSRPPTTFRITIGGSAEYEMEIVATVGGGPAVLSGTVTGFADKIYAPSGSIAIAGAVAVDEFELSYEGSGSSSFAGAGLYEYTLNWTWSLTSGGAVFTGAAPAEQTFEYNGLYFGEYYYPINEKTGTTVSDSFSLSNDITLSAADLWTDDSKFISAVNFEKNDWATLGTDVEPLAVSFWHKRNTTDQDSYRVFSSSPDDIHWYFAYGPPYFRAVIRNNTNYYYFFNGTDYVLIPDDGEYHWYYIEFYSASNATLYIDNVYRGTTTNFFSTGSFELHTIGNGGDSAPTGVYGFGLVDDLRIYTSERLNADKRNKIFTLSPDPGSMELGGAATIQIVQDSATPAEVIYEFTPTGGMEFSGQRYSYISSGITTTGGSAAVETEFEFEGSGSITLQSTSTYTDFGLGYVYDIVTGFGIHDGDATTTHTRDFVYTNVSGGMALSGLNHGALFIEGSYYIIISEIGRARIRGEAIIQIDAIQAQLPEGGAITGGAIPNPVKGVVTKAPSGKATVEGSAEYVFYPNSGYQELGL